MTLLGELHGHNLQPGLSISHLTRAISMENVCEHPPDPFFVVFVSAEPERKLFFAHAFICVKKRTKQIDFGASNFFSFFGPCSFNR